MHRYVPTLLDHILATVDLDTLDQDMSAMVSDRLFLLSNKYSYIIELFCIRMLNLPG